MSGKLQTIISESGLDATKAKVVQERFADAFEVAAEWEALAKTIVVTDESQVADMEKAREGRLILKKMRIAIKDTHKELKAQSLLEGKAIDGMKNVLTALIEPTEKYLLKQERFVEIKQEERDKEDLRLAEVKRQEEAEAERKAEAERQEEVRLDNIRLRKQTEEIEAELRAGRERAKAEKEAADEKVRKIKAENEAKLKTEREKVEAEKKKAEDEAQRVREENEANLRVEREKLEAEQKKAADEKAQLERQKDEAEGEARLAQAELDAAEKKRQDELSEESGKVVQCPHCLKTFPLFEVVGK